MAAFLDTALHDGSLWEVLACLLVFVGVAVPPEATGREELDTILSPRRSGRLTRRRPR